MCGTGVCKCLPTSNYSPFEVQPIRIIPACPTSTVRYSPAPAIRMRMGSFIYSSPLVKAEKQSQFGSRGRAFVILNGMYLKILAHPVFINLNFHMPMIVDLSHPLIMLQGENGAGKSTLLHSIFYALRGEQVEGYVYRLESGDVEAGKAYLFDAEQHNPRVQTELFKDQPEMIE